MNRDIDTLTDTTEIHELYETYAGELAFDVGASVGKVAGIFAQHFGRVVACEPSPEPYSELFAHSAPNVVTLPVAVSDVDGDVELVYREMSEEWGYLFTGDSLPEWGAQTGSLTVPAVTVDSLVGWYGLPDLVKVDTEGHEVRVVQGGMKAFGAGVPFLIEVHSEANGDLLADLLPPFRIVRHELHEPGGYSWSNHWWAVSEGSV